MCFKYDIPFSDGTLHEFVISGKKQKDRGVKVLDIAKALLDYGYHSPTIYFPNNVPEAMMIEPTESETYDTLNEFAKALVEIDQAGIFLIKNVPEDVLGRMLATSCANILFPFAREAVSDIVTRGGFPQLLLTPVNFDALYDQQKKQASEQAAKNTTH